MNSREIRRVSVSRAVFGTMMLSLAAVSVQAQDPLPDELYDFAGNGEPGYRGADDGGLATEARINLPLKMVFDASDNAFIAEFNGNRIRRVDGATGIISTVAGTGNADYNGDGTALAVNFDGPISVDVDASGNLYVVEHNGSLLRKIDTMGNVTTIAGIPGDSGPPRTGDEGALANTVRLNQPWDVDISDAGHIYLAEPGSHCVRRIDATTGIISTVAGSCRNSGFAGDGGAATSARLAQPHGVFVDASENLYIADSNNHRIRYVDATTGTISTIAGNGNNDITGDGGLATDAATRDPRRVFVNAAGEVYLNDVDNHVVRKIGTDNVIDTIAGIAGVADYTGRGHVATESALNLPQGAIEDSAGTVYIVDQQNHLIRQILAGTVNNPPTDIDNTEEFIADALDGNNARVGGLMTSVDLDTVGLSQDGLFEYSLVYGNGNDDNENFRFASNNRVLRFNGASALPTGDYFIRVQTDDLNGATFQKAIVVSLVSGAPQITLLGDDPQVIPVGGSYVEAGATAVDDVDGDVTAGISIDSSDVNTNAPGSYEVSYEVTDSDGNTAIVNRAVIIDGPPSITLNGDAAVTLNVGDTYTEQGATAADDRDGDISGDIVIGGDAVDTATAGTYEVTYDVTDSIGNAAATVIRTVTVQDGMGGGDTTPPVITLTGANPQAIEVGGTYTELGATATDDVDGDISGSIVIDDSAVDTGTIGSYQVTYDVMDAAGNAAAQQVRTVNVVDAGSDTTPPVITLIGDATVTLTVGDTYTEEGATAEDDVDGDITADIVVGGDTVDTSTAGTYEVTYDVSDDAGNAAATVTRTVTVNQANADTEPPVITLLGANPQVITVNNAYVELGAEATDNFDGDVSNAIVIDSSAVDTTSTGTYQVTYDVTDAAGNAAATVTRDVTVEAAPVTPPPPSNNSSGGGGSFGLLGLLGLAIIATRRRWTIGR